jgi:ATP-binding cassette subfamily B protein
MRRIPSAAPRAGPARGGDWRAIRTLLPYLWAYKGRVIVAMVALVAAKLANVGVPLLMKEIVDSLDARTARSGPARAARAYGLLRLSTTAFHRAARVPVRQGHAARGAHDRARSLPPSARAVAALPPRAPDGRAHARRRARDSGAFDADQLHAVLDPAHARRESGSLPRSWIARYDWTFVAITLTALVLYIAATITITDWRTAFRRQMNELDSKANTRAIDSLLNYETVKYSATRSSRRAATTRACSAGRRRR